MSYSYDRTAKKDDWTERQDRTPDAESQASDLEDVLRKGSEDYAIFEAAHEKAQGITADLMNATSSETQKDFEANISNAKAKMADVKKLVQAIKAEAKKDADLNEVVAEVLDTLKSLGREFQDL